MLEAIHVMTSSMFDNLLQQTNKDHNRKVL